MNTEKRREVTRMATEAQIKAQAKYDAENTRSEDCEAIRA